MRQAGVTVAAQRPRKERAWVDFGLQDSWEPAPRRRRPVSDLDAPPRRRATAAVATSTRPALAEPSSSPAPVRAPSPDEQPITGSALTSTVARPVDYAETMAVGATDPEARHTVTIRGRGAERDLAFPEYRSARSPATPRHERPGFKPDRTALWAVLLGLLLVFVAVASAHASVLAHHVH